MYKYETHLHTSPVSKCARSTPAECLELYKKLGYDGIFITNHFLDGNIADDCGTTYEEKIGFYFSDYENAKKLEKDFGIKVFCGVEMSYKGTDFLVYGLDKQWYLNHPEIIEMKKTDELAFLMSEGALVIQAHPFREASYINHIRLFPRSVHGVETFNSSRTEFENSMADLYAENYGLLKFAGSDNHNVLAREILAGMRFETPVESEQDFVSRILSGEGEIFKIVNTEYQA